MSERKPSATQIEFITTEELVNELCRRYRGSDRACAIATTEIVVGPQGPGEVHGFYFGGMYSTCLGLVMQLVQRTQQLGRVQPAPMGPHDMNPTEPPDA